MAEGFDVLVCGAGPTGLVTALLLAQLGRRVAVLERHEAIYPLPRAIAFDHEVARILNKLRLYEEMQQRSSEPGLYQWRNQHGDLLFELDWSGMESISGFPTSFLFSQPDMEDVLNRAAEGSDNISIFRGVEVQSVSQSADRVMVNGVRTSGEEVNFTGHWLVGADGANSVVRQSTGADYQDLGFRADWLVVDVQPKTGMSLPVDDDLMLQVCDPARPTTVVSGGPGRRRWEFMALEGETLADLNSEERAWFLLAPWQVTPDNAVLERHAVYTFRGALADTWRSGRIFIAGDAAHLTPPFAGQGLCAGFRDAAGLAWRLDLALKGLAKEAVLDSYESERKEHARAWIMNAIELGGVICVLDPQAADGRDAGMKAAREAGEAPPSDGVLPSLGPGTHLPEQHGGTLARGATVGHNGGVDHCDNYTGSGFLLLSRSGEMPGGESAKVFSNLGGTLAHIGERGDYADHTGSYGRWFDSLGADVALVRPDFYLFGTDSGPGGADRLVAALAALLDLKA